MEKIIISESGNDCSHISYLYHMLAGDKNAVNSNLRLSIGYDRIYLEVNVKNEYAEETRNIITSAVADIICIGYKYSYLKKLIPLNFLNNIEREILIAALIAADFTDDKKYVVRRFVSDKEYSIDGFFNFRMNALKRKWDDIALYIPDGFSVGEFDDFIVFLLEGDNGKIYIKDNEVFDEKYRKLRRSRLIGSFPEYSFFREVILSGANNIFCLTNPPYSEVGFLKKYYGSRIFFT